MKFVIVSLIALALLFSAVVVHATNGTPTGYVVTIKKVEISKGRSEPSRTVTIVGKPRPSA